jgi:tetratricopeptide (TPR) repeat protein
LCHSLDRPLLLYVALMGQWRYSLNVNRLTTTKQIAERVYSLAQKQNDPSLMMGACHALAATLHFMGNFGEARKHATLGVQIWRSGAAQSSVEDVETAAVTCLCYQALADWHFGETASSQATMAEAMSLAKESNDMHGLAVLLCYAAGLCYVESKPAEAERLAAELIQLSTRQHFTYWMAIGTAFRGWALSASGDVAQGILWIEDAIRDHLAGSRLSMPVFLAMKAEALYLADRAADALEAIKQAEAIVEISEERRWCAELSRLRGMLLATLGADENQIEASFRTAIRIAREQKSRPLVTRAEETYAEYRRQKQKCVERSVSLVLAEC